MPYDFLTDPLYPWQHHAGSLADVVIDSRVRLMRNIKQYSFPGRASSDELEAVLHKGKAAVPALNALGKGEYQCVALESLSLLERELLAAKHIVSAAQLADPAHRAVLVREDGAVAVMINESDHFCIQTAAAGFSLPRVWDDASQVDDCLESQFDIAFRDDFGYETASPSATGTGLTVGVTIHVPALVMMKRLSRIMQGITKFGFALCGMYGGRDECVGNIFQITNQITLGVSEIDILEQMRKIIVQIVQEERNCRQMVWQHDKDLLRDTFGRACGILRHAWLLRESESLSLASDLRFGIDMDVIPMPPVLYDVLRTVVTPAFLQVQAGKELDDAGLMRCRAETVRHMLDIFAGQSDDTQEIRYDSEQGSEDR